jgi:hypothetical protein
LNQIGGLVNSTFKASHLSRYDESGDLIEASYWIEIKSPEDLEDFKTGINKLSPETHVSFVDNKSF